MCVLLLVVGSISAGTSAPAAPASLAVILPFASAIAAIAVYALGLLDTCLGGARSARAFQVLVLLVLLQQLVIDALALASEEFSGGRTASARGVSLAVNLVLNAAAAAAAGRYAAGRASDPSVRPEMEAVQMVPDIMNRVGMPSHDQGVAPHDAGFIVTGPRRR